MFKKSVNEWEAVIQSLKTQKEAVAQQIESISQERKSYQLEASLGDTQAQASLDKLTQQYQSLKVQHEDLDGAIEQAEAKLDGALDEAERKAKHKRAQEVEQALAGYSKACRDVDEALSKVTGPIATYLEKRTILASAVPDLPDGIRFMIENSNNLMLALGHYLGNHPNWHYFPVPVYRKGLAEIGKDQLDSVRNLIQTLKQA